MVSVLSAVGAILAVDVLVVVGVLLALRVLGVFLVVCVFSGCCIRGECNRGDGHTTRPSFGVVKKRAYCSWTYFYFWRWWSPK